MRLTEQGLRRMHYSLIQDNYKCHCGSGIYLGFKYYPQPYFLLAYAGVLREQGHSVTLQDLFLSKKRLPEDNDDNFILGTGEYAADTQYSYSLPMYRNVKYLGMHAWSNKNTPSKIHPQELINQSPAWDLIDFDQYPKPNGRRRACIRLSFGCPNKCFYCPVPKIFDGKYIKYDIEWAKAQLELLYKKYHIEEFSITDDNLFADMRTGKQLLQWISENIKATFFLQEGIEVKQAEDIEFCKLLKQANFYDIRLGIETLDGNVLEKAKKPYHDASAVYRATKNLKSVGFSQLKAFLIQGLPGNTSRQETKDVETLTSLGYTIRNHVLKSYEKITSQKRLI